MKLVLLTVLCPSQLRAQTNLAKPGPHSNRYLLIVETSRAMERRSEAALKVAQGLLVSGMNGQLQRGDSLGVWTFNEELYAGRLALQPWSPEAPAQKAVAKRTLNFLQGQKFEKQANLSKVLPTLDRVIKGSGVITVILISAGDEKIHGTPYDEEINRAYKLWHQQQKEARMPIVTVLRGKNGKITDYSVTASPWTVEIPPLQPEKEIAESAPPKPEPQKSPPPAVQPLILSGKKSEAAPQPKPADPTAANPEPAPPGAVSEAAKTQDVAAPPATSEKPPTPPATTAKIEEPSPDSAAVKAEAASPAPGQSSAGATPAQSVPSVKTEADKLNFPPAETNSFPSFARPAESRPGLSPRAVVVPARGEPSAATPTQSPQTAVAAPPESFLRQMSFWLVAVVVAGISLSVVVLLMRRARASSPASLITRSLGPNQK